MTTLSIHPIEHLREHVNHAHIMKKAFRLLTLIGLTLMLVGTLCSTLASIHSAARNEVAEAHMNVFPAEMPDVVVEPMIGFPAY